MAESGENHREADADAAGDDPGGFPPLWPDSCPAAAEPPSIIGEGDTNLLADLAEFPNPYPSAHLDKIDQAADVFGKARDELGTIAGDLKAKLMSLTGNNVAEDLDALDEFWRRVDGGDDTLFGALQHSTDTLANACTSYGTHVIDARNEINWIVGEVVVELVAAGIVTVIASLYTAGGRKRGRRLRWARHPQLSQHTDRRHRWQRGPSTLRSRRHHRRRPLTTAPEVRTNCPQWPEGPLRRRRQGSLPSAVGLDRQVVVSGTSG